MTAIVIGDPPLRGECQVDVTDEILGETPSLGNFFSAATPPSNPSPVDDALAIARFDDWLSPNIRPRPWATSVFPRRSRSRRFYASKVFPCLSRKTASKAGYCLRARRSLNKLKSTWR